MCVCVFVLKLVACHRRACQHVSTPPSSLSSALIPFQSVNICPCLTLYYYYHRRPGRVRVQISVTTLYYGKRMHAPMRDARTRTPQACAPGQSVFALDSIMCVYVCVCVLSIRFCGCTHMWRVSARASRRVRARARRPTKKYARNICVPLCKQITTHDHRCRRRVAACVGSVGTRIYTYINHTMRVCVCVCRIHT